MIKISPVEITSVSPIISPLPSIKVKPNKELIKQVNQSLTSNLADYFMLKYFLTNKRICHPST